MVDVCLLADAEYNASERISRTFAHLVKTDLDSRLWHGNVFLCDSVPKLPQEVEEEMGFSYFLPLLLDVPELEVVLVF